MACTAAHPSSNIFSFLPLFHFSKSNHDGRPGQRARVTRDARRWMAPRPALLQVSNKSRERNACLHTTNPDPLRDCVTGQGSKHEYHGRARRTPGRLIYTHTRHGLTSRCIMSLSLSRSLAALRALPPHWITVERVTGNRGRGQERTNIKGSILPTAKNSTVLGVSEHAESIGLALILASPFLS